MPWSAFVAVRKTVTDANMAPLDPTSVESVALIYSRFEFNKYPNLNYTPGAFTFELEGGVQTYVAPRPQLVLVSSAGVERFARHNGDETRRAMDVPIVQLNPGGVLNHKYAGENAVRYAGLTYTIVRPTGMVEAEEGAEDKGVEGGVHVEIAQGDAITGRITRSDLAKVILAAAGTTYATDVTFEVRRKEGPRDLEALQGPTNIATTLQRTVPDRQRTNKGLPVLPAETPVPEQLTQARVEEILSDPRVAASVRRNAGGRVRDEAKGRDLTGEERIATNATEARVKGGAAAVSEYGLVMPGNKRVDPVVPTTTAAENKVSAQAWIKTWREGGAATTKRPASFLDLVTSSFK